MKSRRALFINIRQVGKRIWGQLISTYLPSIHLSSHIIRQILYGPGCPRYEDLILELNSYVTFWKIRRGGVFPEALVNGPFPEDMWPKGKCSGVVGKCFTQKMLV